MFKVREHVHATQFRPELDVHDVARASISELCDHIVVGHHEPLRRELPRINDVLDTVVRVHASTHPELHDLQRLFVGVRSAGRTAHRGIGRCEGRSSVRRRQGARIVVPS